MEGGGRCGRIQGSGGVREGEVHGPRLVGSLGRFKAPARGEEVSAVQSSSLLLADSAGLEVVVSERSESPTEWVEGSQKRVSVPRHGWRAEGVARTGEDQQVDEGLQGSSEKGHDSMG